MKAQNKDFNLLNSALNNAQNVLFLTHHEPDGDALGSLAGFKYAMDNSGISADIFYTGKISRDLRQLPFFSDCYAPNDIKDQYDLIIGLDYGDIGRIGRPENILLENKENIFATVDHHFLGTHFGFLKIVDANAASTSQMVYRFLIQSNISIDARMASSLLTGILTDTYSFTNPNTTSEVMEISADLLKRGAMVPKVASLNFAKKNTISRKIWGMALERAKYFDAIGLAFSSLSFGDFPQGYNLTDLSGVSNMLLSTFGAKVSLLISEFEPGYLDGSLRADVKSGIDVSSIAKQLGGGGHKLAAGFRRKGKIADALQTVKEALIL